jgi:hypothetical protein
VARIADIGNRKTDGSFATLCRLAEEVLRCAREAVAQREALPYQLLVTDVWSPEQLEHDAGTHEPISVDEAIEVLMWTHDEEVNTDD